MATHFSNLVWRFPWTEELEKLQSMGSQRVRHNLMTEHTHMHTINIPNVFSCVLYYLLHL